MKPFSAWLAMDGSEPNGDAVFSNETTAEKWSEDGHEPQRVLIVADTPENRKLLGMEEGS